MNIDITDPVGTICSLIDSIPHTLISGVWFWISFAFSKYWYAIVPVLIIWLLVEILTRYKHSFNSDNGFTPIFNSFVGGGVFFVFSSLINLILEFFLGKLVNCSLLAVDSFYLLPFVMTALSLRLSGFWTYSRILGEKPRRRRRK